MTNQLQRKIDFAINLLQSIPQDGPIEICYSGGKDSDVILNLAKMAGIPFDAIYKNTTIDPPGTIQHCRENGVRIVSPNNLFISSWNMPDFQIVGTGYAARPSRSTKFTTALSSVSAGVKAPLDRSGTKSQKSVVYIRTETGCGITIPFLSGQMWTLLSLSRIRKYGVIRFTMTRMAVFTLNEGLDA